MKDTTTARILLVDDEQVVTRALGRGLQRLGYDVGTADRGQAALDLAAHEDFDLVVSDLVMPGMDGIALLQAFKSRHPNVPFLILTGKGDMESAIHAFRLGADDFLVKPCDIGELVFRIENCRDRYRLKREVEETQKALKVAAEQWERTFEAIPEGLALLTPEGRILRCNAGMERLLERPREEIQGRICYELVHRDYKPIDGCPLLKMKESHHRESMDLPIGDRWFRVTVDPLFVGGALDSAIHLIEDITAARRQEIALRDSEEKYRLVVENVNDAIFIVQDERIRFCNQRAMALLGLFPDAPGDGRHEESLQGTDRDVLLDICRKRVSGDQEDGPRVLCLKGPAQNDVWAQVSTSRITWEGRPGVLAVLMDISGQKEMEGRLAQAKHLEALGVMAGGIAHQFNNALTSIFGYIQLIQFHTATLPLEKYIRHIRGAGERMAELVQQLVAYAGKAQYRNERICLGDFLRTWVSAGAGLVKPYVRVEMEIRGEELEIMGDPKMLRIALASILKNAEEAMDQGGRIRILLERQAREVTPLPPDSRKTETGRAMVTVIDEGIGMSPNTIDRIFDPFFSTKFPGRGLGMAAAHGIVSTHGGSISVRSTLGKGTSIIVAIPLAFPPTERDPTHGTS